MKLVIDVFCFAKFRARYKEEKAWKQKPG